MNDAIELGSLEIRKLFKDLNPTALDKKVNVDYLEKELGLKRFFPQSVINSHKVNKYSNKPNKFSMFEFVATSTSKMY